MLLVVGFAPGGLQGRVFFRSLLAGDRSLEFGLAGRIAAVAAWEPWPVTHRWAEASNRGASCKLSRLE